jgi:hypothetical protein
MKPLVQFLDWQRSGAGQPRFLKVFDGTEIDENDFFTRVEKNFDLLGGDRYDIVICSMACR